MCGVVPSLPYLPSWRAYGLHFLLLCCFSLTRPPKWIFLLCSTNGVKDSYVVSPFLFYFFLHSDVKFHTKK